MKVFLPSRLSIIIKKRLRYKIEIINRKNKQSIDFVPLVKFHNIRIRTLNGLRSLKRRMKKPKLVRLELSIILADIQ